jgi:ABC-type uncharacterized transport system ATPase subunit
MSAVETAKIIRIELANTFPEIKFSVRKTDAAVIYVTHQINDLAFRHELSTILRKFEGWNEFGTEYVFEQYV